MSQQSRHPVRIRPAPRADGPYDDEIEPPPYHIVGSLALAFPASDHAAGRLRLVPHRDAPAGQRQALPDPRSWAGRLAQAIAEVLAGARPAAQLGRFATLDVVGLLERGAGRLAARTGGPARRPVIASVHVSEPRDGVAEACAVVDTGVRRRALALRLEGVDGRWRCTALQVG